MEAPDKIYIRPSAFEVPWPACIDENAKYGGIEYIRKDSLIEWLQQGFDWIKNPVISVQQIIDKLNSM